MMQVAIPSYKRAETLRDKTLALLGRHGFDPKSITVFVASEQEAEVYARVLPSGAYKELIVGVIGIAPQRNFMLDHYPEGTRVLSIDDDITKVSYSEGPKSLVEHADLRQLADDAFEICKQVGARIWGLYPVPNPYFMKPTVSTDLKFLIGCLVGYVNHRGPGPLRITLHDKDDVERTCNCYLTDGAVVRMNSFTMHQNYLTEKGGLQEMRTDDTIRAAAARLVEMFPDLCSMNKTKKGGVADVRLRDRRPR